MRNIAWQRCCAYNIVLKCSPATKALQLLQNGRSRLPTLEQWSDIERADKMARRAAGLEANVGSGKVNVSLELVNQRILVLNATMPPDAPE